MSLILSENQNNWEYEGPETKPWVTFKNLKKSSPCEILKNVTQIPTPCWKREGNCELT